MESTIYCILLPWGKFKFKRLLMGISTTPDEYQVCMELILEDLPFIIRDRPFVDLNIVFNRLQKFDVTHNTKKCQIPRDSVNYMGFTLTPNGIQPQVKKPARLNRLASNNVPFTWAPEYAIGISNIKEALARNKWFALSDYARTFHVVTDASVRQIGGLIVQGKRVLVCFFRSVTDTQATYSTMEWDYSRPSIHS
ncbi:hypothetical protein PHMEG_00014068 [Phytophthora megakarya]|uniref:Reverse transcriptase/retrotransposon-derived protein RNase H-like domain-containing protein n=1 Tax=Phytophthora megakarya TaxID=4795 RepID=A0A225W4Q9_9STRA|nr:hypothetical protein PHMEG_00014068 [Phytophthora megakarya]